MIQIVQVLVNKQFMDFTAKEDGKRIKGYRLNFIRQPEKKKEGLVGPFLDHLWIPFDNSHLIEQADELLPGQVFDFDYSIINRKAVITDIIPGELAADFDKILEERG